MCARASQKNRVPSLYKRRLRAESLEPRRLLAGDVSASVVRGTLLLTGDNLDNFVEVFGTGTPGQFVVEGFTDNHGVNTTINHTAGQKTFNGVTNITVSFKRGDDFFGFEQGTLAGNLNIDMSDGNDEVNVGIPKLVTGSFSAPTAKPLIVPPTIGAAATIGGSLCVNLGSGNNWLIEGSTHVKQSETVTACDGGDKIEFIDTGGVPGGVTTIGNGVTVDHDLTLNLGGGKNYLDAYDLTVNGLLKVNASGQNSVELAVLNVAKDAIFNLCGSCNQDLFIGPEEDLGTPVASQQNHVGGNLTVNTGSGNDNVTESSLSVGGSNRISTGNGNDAVILGDLDDNPPDVNYQVTVAKDLCVDLGCGQDSFHGQDVRVTGNVTIAQGLGASTITLQAFILQKALNISTDGGKDDVTLDTVLAGSSQVNLGAGDDTLSVRFTTISTSTFEGGTGVNTYTDGGGNDLVILTKRHFT